jgi:glutamine synthetase
MLLAGLDGIKRNIEPRAPVDLDTYELPEEIAETIPVVPGSLPAALDALEADNDFLLEGGVFTSDLIETWIEFKRKREIDAVNLRPHPWEYHLYYDI